MLTNSDIAELVAFRRQLHAWPEISGEEEKTAATIVEALRELAPNEILTGLGGHGVAAIFDSGTAGETVLFRAELDALPIQELSDNAWASMVPGKGHLCGHDGHMTMLLALGRLLARQPVETGRVVLMFQPAEEDGSGARAVVADKRYPQISPDWAFAIHNEPGRPLGFVSVREGLMNCASSGLQVTLSGKTAHAANPEDGRSPVNAVVQLLPRLSALGLEPDQADAANDKDFRLSTVTHVGIGEPTFGVAPGEAVIHVTLRTATDDDLAKMTEQAKAMVTECAMDHDLQVAMNDCDVFAATVNDAEATRIATASLEALSIDWGDYGLPMRASEDFGVFGWQSKSAMLCLGSGEKRTALHNPDFDFPDDLIPVGAAIFQRIAHDLLSPNLKDAL